MGLNTWGDAILHSLYGKKFGLDPNNYVAGPAGYRNGIESVTTAGTALAPSGISNLANTTTGGTAVALTLPGPSLALRGLTKVINNISTGSPIYTVTLSTGYFGTSTGVPACTAASFGSSVAWGQSLSLQYISSAVAMVIGSAGTITYA